MISGDFHVHGGASFDSSIPDLERVTSFLATGVDMIVATDHNVVTTYASTLETLGATHTLAVIPGVEQTPNIPWFYVPGHEFPRTLGHFNFWPLIAGRARHAQRRAVARAAGAGATDGRHGRAVRAPGGVDPPAQSPLQRGQVGARPGLRPRHRVRPAAGDPGRAHRRGQLRRRHTGAPPRRQRALPERRLERAGGDDRCLARGLASLSGALVFTAVAGAVAHGHRQQRFA